MPNEAGVANPGTASGLLHTACPQVALVELGVHFRLFVWERGVVLRTGLMSVLLGVGGLRPSAAGQQSPGIGSLPLPFPTTEHLFQYQIRVSTCSPWTLLPLPGWPCVAGFKPWTPTVHLLLSCPLPTTCFVFQFPVMEKNGKNPASLDC